MVAVIAVVVVVFLSAVFLGVFSGGASSGTGAVATGPTFSSARAVADRFAAAHGNWSLIEAVGVALANASFLPYNGSTENASCIPVTLVGTTPANVTIPAFRGNLESGEAPVWLFAYIEPGVGGELALFEVGGEISLAVELPASCSAVLSEFHGISTPVIDSSVAVAAAAAAGGASFLRAHPTGVSLLMELIGAFTSANETTSAPLWEVSWSTCSNGLFGSGSMTSGFRFSAAMYATNGSVLPFSAVNSTCGASVSPPSSGISSAISFGPADLEVGPGTNGTIASQGCNSGDFCYAVPIDVAAESITPGDFELTVENFSDGSPFTAAGFAIVNVEGTVLVYSIGAMETQWTSTTAGNSQTLLAAGMDVFVDVGPSTPALENLGLLLTGEGPFVNSGLEITL